MLINLEDAAKLYTLTKPTMCVLIKRNKLKAKGVQAKVILHPNCLSSSSGRYRIQKTNLYDVSDIDKAVRAEGKVVLEHAQIKSLKRVQLSAE